MIWLRPKYQNHFWSIDFVHDKLINQRPCKMLTVLDEYTREALCVSLTTKMESANRSVALVLLEALDVEHELKHSRPNRHLSTIRSVLAALFSLVSGSPDWHFTTIAVRGD